MFRLQDTFMPENWQKIPPLVFTLKELISPTSHFLGSSVEFNLILAN